ncbi:MAG: hypothetical protein LKI26_08975, partial [Bifidobacterium tibiigranuli]|nr:hypothetical protein [Bifidobacterium tibiigranuli]
MTDSHDSATAENAAPADNPAIATTQPRNATHQNQPLRNVMTDTTFFLNRLSSEPHALAFGGQST